MKRDSDDEQQDAINQLLAMGAVDMTQRAQSGALSHAYGREPEVTKVLESLASGQSVLLVGRAGVGKTAIWHEVIARIIHSQCPPVLQGMRFISISTGMVMVGTKYLGEWQTRLGELLDGVREARNVYLFFEDIWALRDAGRASDKTDGFATFLRPYLERRQLVVLGESTPENYTSEGYGPHALADDHSLMKHFSVITVEEPARDATKSILTAVARDLQKAHKVRVEAAAIERALELTRRFLPYQAFPGKAIHLLSETAQFRGKQAKGAPAIQHGGRGDALASADDVTSTFSRITGLPEKIISDTVPLSQDEIQAYFTERVIGQMEAVSAVVDVVTLVKAELNDPGRPLGVLFFVGPTGVGKTELAKTLAEYLFGSKEKLIRLDMSEYKSGAGYSDLQQQLTEKQRRQSFSVLLLDEIEKASPYVFDLFLQVFDDGRLTDASGRSVDLHNTIIIMTSNVGTQLGERGGFGFLDSGDRAAERRQQIVRAVEEYFRPEFINRIDKIVVFQPLGIEEMRRIARRELGRALLREGVLRRNILLDFREEVLDVLLAAGFSATFGARPLQRAIKEHVLLPLARRIAAQPSAGEQLLELCVRDGHIDAEIIPVNPAAQAEHADDTLAGLHERLTVTDALSGHARTMNIRQLDEAIDELHARIETQLAGERYQAIESQAIALLEETSKPSFWDDQDHARQVLAAVYHLERLTDRFTNLRSRVERLAEVALMIRRHNDAAGLPRLASSFEQLERDVALAEIELLAGDDASLATDAVFLRMLPVAAARGRETHGAVAWCAQLQEMYTRWAMRKGHEVELVSEPGAEHIILLLRGPNLPNILRGEEGIHKLQSESEDERQRSHGRSKPQVDLARVEVLTAPPVDEVPFGKESVRILDTQDGRARGGKERTPGAGAPVSVAEAHDSATGERVRIRAANAGEVALRLLAAQVSRRTTHPTPGDEIVRVYHLARTQYVRDPRTGQREGRTRDVLDGAIDPFLLAYLQRELRQADADAEVVAPPATSRRDD